MEVPAKLRTAMVKIRYCFVVFLILAVATLLAACGDETKTVTIIVPDIGTIVLTIENDTLVAGGMDTTVVTAEVYNFNGDPVPDGTAVSFEVMPTGSINAETTTINGIAKTLLTSDMGAGEFYVTAKSGEVSQIAFGEFIAGPANAEFTHNDRFAIIGQPSDSTVQK